MVHRNGFVTVSRLLAWPTILRRDKPSRTSAVAGLKLDLRKSGKREVAFRKTICGSIAEVQAEFVLEGRTGHDIGRARLDRFTSAPYRAKGSHENKCFNSQAGSPLGQRDEMRQLFPWGP